MELICKGRGQGKTHDLILKSAKTGIPILTTHNPVYILEQARYMGVKIHHPMTVKEYKYLMDKGSLTNNKFWTGSLLADDIDEILHQLLNADIKTATCTPDGYEREERTEMIHDSLYCSSNCNFTYTEHKIHLPNGMNFVVKNGKNYKIELPVIKDVNVIVPGMVVEVVFEDGSKEKAVCRKPDVFSLEIAVSICISKKIMGGSGAYNNAVKHGLKVYNDKLKKEQADKEEKERIKKKYAKRSEYKKRKAAEKEDAEKERQIEIQKEAYIRAMNAVKKFEKVVTDKENK